MSSLPQSTLSLQDSTQNQALAPPSLSATHFLVAHKLAQGRSKTSIARSLSITPQTIYNMLKDPEFCTYLAHVQEDMKLKVALSNDEIQRRLNEDALTSLETLQDIRDGEFMDAPVASVRLKAATFLLDKASNMPKSSKDDKDGTTVNIFSPQFIQTLVETARQVGDASVFDSANLALSTIAAQDRIIDINEEKADYSAAPNPILPPKMPSTRVQTLDELLSSSISDSEEEEDE